MDSRKNSFSRWDRWLRQAGDRFGATVSDGNRLETLIDAHRFVPRMLEAIAESRSSVTFQFYNIEADEGGRPFAEALIEARRRGVVVKVIFDAVEMFLETNGRWAFLPFQTKAVRDERRATREMIREMERAGIEIFRYGWKYGLCRHHSKSLVVDHHTTFISGFNPTAHNFGWHEVCVIARGPVVTEVQRRFMEVFLDSGPSNPLPRTEARMEGASEGVSATATVIAHRPYYGDRKLKSFLLEAIANAEHSIWIENAYLSHGEIVEGLLCARRRGVGELHLIVPEKSNHATVDRSLRRNFGRLASEGIQTHLYSSMTHAKVMVIDEVFVCLGSCNFESFSLDRQNELNLVAIDADGKLAGELRETLFAPDLRKCRDAVAEPFTVPASLEAEKPVSVAVGD